MKKLAHWQPTPSALARPPRAMQIWISDSPQLALHFARIFAQLALMPMDGVVEGASKGGFAKRPS